MHLLPNIKIELPNLQYKNSFLLAAQEFKAVKHKKLSDKNYDKYPASMADDEFQKNVVQPKIDAITGKGKPVGYIPTTTYWIIETSNDGIESYVGRISLRHGLTEALKQVGGNIGYDITPSRRGKGYIKTALRLVLENARKMEMSQVLLTCDDTNEASKRTIIGVFKEYGGKEETPTASTHFESDGDKEIRFWVNTSPLSPSSS